MLPLAGLRIARIATVPLFFSTHLRFQLPALVEAGANVTAISSEGTEQIEVAALHDELSIATVDIPRSIALISDLRALAALMRHLRRRRYHLVHSTTPKAGLLVAIAATIARVPVRVHTFTGQRWATQSGLQRTIGRTADRLIIQLCTRCYADSHSQRQYLLDERIGKASKLFVLGDGSIAGIDTQRFSTLRAQAIDRVAERRKRYVNAEDTVFLFLGRINSDKGIGELAAAQSLLDREDVHLWVAGPVEEPELLDRLRQAGANCLGFVQRPEDIIPLADVLVLPSYREGFGSVVLEAAAMGVPSIGTNINGLKDAIVDGETGLLVAPKDARSLATAMRRMADEPDTRIQMGRAAAERAVSHFAAERLNALQINEYARLAKSALARRC